MKESRTIIQDTNRTICLLLSDAELVKTIFKTEMGNRNFFWMYLGMDVIFDLDLRSLADPLGKRISISEHIQVNARQYRDEYIHCIGDLMPEDNLQSWWLSNISEKNPFIFNPFLAFCYIQACRNVIETHPGNFVIICQTNGLLLSLKKHLDHHGIRTEVRTRSFRKVFSSMRQYTAGVARLGWYGMTYGMRSVLARFYGCTQFGRIQMPAPRSPWICIHAWVDSRNFKNGSSFSDIYFGDLGSNLKKKGYLVMYLADILPTYSYLAAMDNLKKTKTPCILLEQLISPWDVLLSFIRVRVPKVRPELARIGDVDLSEVIREIMKRDFLDARRRWSFLCYRAAEKICSISAPSRFIYTFENHMWEKMFFLGFRQSSRKTGLVGYAHTIVNTMFTSYSISYQEQKDAPVPDRIIVNGTAAARVLMNSGFPADRIDVGGSLRYSHLWNTTPLVKKYHDKTIVIIAASADIDDTFELLIQSIHAFGAKPQYQVIVKCHPTVPYSLIAAGLSELPDNFIVSEEPIASVIREADLLVYTSSASAVEAFALGLPIIHLKSEYRIDMNIFEEIPGIPSMAGEQLADTDQVIRSIDHFYEQFGKRENREDLLKTIFAPPDNESALLFISEITR